MININDFNRKIDTIKIANDKLFNNQLKDKELFKNVIFIYTPPKVGSTTLVSSLRLSACDKFAIIHLHDEVMLNYLVGVNNITINEIIYYNVLLGKNIYVIDIYRSPIERKISEYFEKLSPYHFNNSEQNLSSYNIDKIINRFNCIFPYLANGDHYVDNYDINVEDFDYNKKYIFQIVNNIKYIKLRLCDSNIWGSILTDILNTEIIIVNDYKTDDKLIGILYEKFKTQYKIPKNYLELIKNDKYLNLFYNEEEKNNYLNNWSNKIDENEFIPFTKEQYLFYVQIYLENQYYPDLQLNHYIDNGCLCNLCSKKRNELFNKAKNNITINEKIIHIEVINENKNNKINNINTKAQQLLNQVKKTNKNTNIKLLSKLSNDLKLSYKNNANNQFNKISFIK